MMYDWANSAYSIFIAVLLPLYAANMAASAGLDNATHVANWAYVSSGTGLVVAVLAPILGSIADYRSLRKRMFAAFFAVGVLATGLIASVNAYVMLLLLYAITYFGFAGANVFYDAFLVDVTTPGRMDKISAWGFGIGYIGGSTIPFLVSIALLQFCGMELSLVVRITSVITALWWGLFTIPFFRNVKQITFIEPEPHLIRNSLRRLGSTLKAVRHYKYMFLFLIGYFFYIDGVGTIIKMATTYADALHLKLMDIVIGLLVTQIVAFPCAILYGNLAGRFSAKRMLLVGVFTYLCVCIVAFTMEKSWQFYLLATLVGTAQGGIQALSRSYFGKLIPDKTRAGEFFGLYNIFGKFESVLGSFLMGVVVTLTGDVHLGVLPILVTFIIGGALLLIVPDDKKLMQQKDAA